MIIFALCFFILNDSHSSALQPTLTVPAGQMIRCLYLIILRFIHSVNFSEKKKKINSRLTDDMKDGWNII